MPKYLLGDGDIIIAKTPAEFTKKYQFGSVMYAHLSKKIFWKDCAQRHLKLYGKPLRIDSDQHILEDMLLHGAAKIVK